MGSARTLTPEFRHSLVLRTRSDELKRIDPSGFSCMPTTKHNLYNCFSSTRSQMQLTVCNYQYSCTSTDLIVQSPNHFIASRSSLLISHTQLPLNPLILPFLTTPIETPSSPVIQPGICSAFIAPHSTHCLIPAKIWLP